MILFMRVMTRSFGVDRTVLKKKSTRLSVLVVNCGAPFSVYPHAAPPKESSDVGLDALTAAPVAFATLWEVRVAPHSCLSIHFETIMSRERRGCAG